MKKYLAVIKIVWQQAFEYRMRMLMWFVVESFPVLATLYLWLGVYSFGEKLGGFDLKTLITYYLISYLIAINISCHFEEDAIENINAGRISQYFTRPLSYKVKLFLSELSWKSIYFLIVGVPFILAIIFLGRNWIVYPTMSNLLLMLPFLILGFILDSIFSYFVVITGFFFEQAISFNHLKWMLIELLSGAILPLSVYPESIQKIAGFLPFHFLRSVPINLFLGRITQNEVPLLILKELAWIAGLYLIMQLLWRQAEKRYTAVGN